jgi:hypothetical protein
VALASITKASQHTQQLRLTYNRLVQLLKDPAIVSPCVFDSSLDSHAGYEETISRFIFLLWLGYDWEDLTG